MICLFSGSTGPFPIQICHLHPDSLTFCKVDSTVSHYCSVKSSHGQGAWSEWSVPMTELEPIDTSNILYTVGSLGWDMESQE